MARDISAKSFDRNKYILQPFNGGSGCMTFAELKARYGLVTEEDLNAPNGVLIYDENGKIDASRFGDNFPIKVYAILEGPRTIPTNDVGVYKIVNFEIGRAYSLAFTGGTATLSGSTIIVSAIGSIGPQTLTIDGDKYVIEVTEIKPKTPVITATATKAGVGASIAINSEGYSTTTTYPHAATDWEISLEEDFSIIIGGAVEDAVNLTSYTTTVAGGGVYYVRCRYIDSVGQATEWSNVLSFDQAELVDNVGTPTVTGVLNVREDGIRIRIKGSPFSSPGGANHIATTWEVSGSADFSTNIYNTAFNTTNLTSLDVEILDQSYSVFYIRAKYHTDSLTNSGYSTAVLLNKANAFPDIPTSQIQVVKDPGADSIVAKFGNSPAISGDGKKAFIAWFNGTDIKLNEYSRPIASGPWSKVSEIGGFGSEGFYNARVDVDRTGDHVVVSIIGNPTGNNYILARGATTLEHKVTVPSSQTEVPYGNAACKITPDGKYVLIGDPFASKALMYKWNGSTYTILYTITPNAAYDNGGTPEISFGHSVSMSADGKTIVISAPDHSVNGRRVGQVQVFRNESDTGYTFVTALSVVGNDEEARGEPYFGMFVEVSYDGTMIAAQTWEEAFAAVYYGSSIQVHRLVSGAWTEGYKIQSSSYDGNMNFGSSIRISSDNRRMYVSSVSMGRESGAVLVYERKNGEWVIISVITAPQTPYGSQFGDGISIDYNEDTILIGGEDYNKPNTEFYSYDQPSVKYSSTQVIKAGTFESLQEIGGQIAISGDGNKLAYIERRDSGSSNDFNLSVYKKSGNSWVFSSSGFVTGSLDVDGSYLSANTLLSLSYNGTRGVYAFNTSSGRTISIFEISDTGVVTMGDTRQENASSNYNHGLRFNKQGTSYLYFNFDSQEYPNQGFIGIQEYGTVTPGEYGVSIVPDEGFTGGNSIYCGDASADLGSIMVLFKNTERGAAYILDANYDYVQVEFDADTPKPNSSYGPRVSYDGTHGLVGPHLVAGVTSFTLYTLSTSEVTLKQKFTSNSVLTSVIDAAINFDNSKVAILGVGSAGASSRVIQIYSLVGGVYVLSNTLPIELPELEAPMAIGEKIVFSNADNSITYANSNYIGNNGVVITYR